jgi:hypothetical protein
MLLQNLVEVKGAPVAGYKSAHPGQIVLPDRLGPGALDVMFCVHPSQGAFRSRQTIFPCRDDTFSAFQLPLLDKELLL